MTIEILREQLGTQNYAELLFFDGGGNMGQIYTAQDLLNKRKVAIKLMQVRVEIPYIGDY